MKITHLSATKLKRNTAEVLNLVAYGELVAIVERYGEPLVKITSIALPKKNANWEKKLKKHFGVIPGLAVVSKTRHFRKRNLSL